MKTTTKTSLASIIQTRHRIPETPLKPEQIIVYQVPIPEPLRFIEPRIQETQQIHALSEYGIMYVKLYENIAKEGHIATAYDYPVFVNQRYVMSPSPIPKFDNPKMDRMPALQIFGAGREKRIYAIPPYTKVKSLDFEDYPFKVEQWSQVCAFCGSDRSFLDEIIVDDRGTKLFICSDTDYCSSRVATGHRGPEIDEGSRARAVKALRKRDGNEPAK
jgi:alpha-D-ribose 1-methylphosphonate 5-phosphate C-P lyase